MIRAGDLDQLISIEQEQTTKGSSGGRQTLWTVLDQDIPAQVLHLSGTERRQTSKGGEAHPARTLFRIRWQEGIDEHMRIVYMGKAYAIVHINNVDERDVVLAITADTVVKYG